MLGQDHLTRKRRTVDIIVSDHRVASLRNRGVALASAVYHGLCAQPSSCDEEWRMTVSLSKTLPSSRDTRGKPSSPSTASP